MPISLSDRQKQEESYHDLKYKNYVDEGPNREMKAYSYFRKFRKNVKNLRILDYGCGNGWLSIDLAKGGAAEVYGIDISKELIEKANQSAEEKGLANKVHFYKMPAENLTFSNDFFDLCLGSAILHHTELNASISNIRRVLKPGGKAIFLEPMNQNIFLRVWRKLTPWRRSPTEKALVNNDLKFIATCFPEAKFQFFVFSSIITEGFLLAFPKNKLIRSLNTIFESLDEKLLKRFPSLGMYCAIVVLELKKEH